MWRVDGKPLLFVYKPNLLPDSLNVTNLWRRLAEQAGLPGLHMVGFADVLNWDAKAHGFDAVTFQTIRGIMGAKRHGIRANLQRLMEQQKGLRRLANHINPGPRFVYRYADVVDRMTMKYQTDDEYYPCVLPNWDNTPRSTNRGWVLHETSPEVFRRQLKNAIAQVLSLPDQHRIIFIKAWNEWAEGNHLEPDLKFGHGYLKVLKEELEQAAKK